MSGKEGRCQHPLYILELRVPYVGGLVGDTGIASNLVVDDAFPNVFGRAFASISGKPFMRHMIYIGYLLDGEFTVFIIETVGHRFGKRISGFILKHLHSTQEFEHDSPKDFPFGIHNMLPP